MIDSCNSIPVLVNHYENGIFVFPGELVRIVDCSILIVLLTDNNGPTTTSADSLHQRYFGTAIGS